MSKESPKQRRLRQRRAGGWKVWWRVKEASRWLSGTFACCASPEAPWTTCCVCGMPVKTCERPEPIGNNWVCPAHPEGAELHDGRWVCSDYCWEKVVDDAERFRLVEDNA